MLTVSSINGQQLPRGIMLLIGVKVWSMKIDEHPFPVSTIGVGSSALINKYQKKREREDRARQESQYDPHWGCTFFRFCWEQGMKLPSVDGCPGCGHRSGDCSGKTQSPAGWQQGGGFTRSIEPITLGDINQRKQGYPCTIGWGRAWKRRNIILNKRSMKSSRKVPMASRNRTSSGVQCYIHQESEKEGSEVALPS